jgi:hypothetical protein
MPAASVEPAVPAIESAKVVPASVRTMMHSVVAVPLMVRTIGSYGVFDPEARVCNSFVL